MTARWESSFPEPPQEEPEPYTDVGYCRECGAAPGAPCLEKCECDLCLHQIELDP